MNFSSDLVATLREHRFIATLVIANREDAVPVGECLLNAGIRVVELTLRTPAAIECIEILSQRLPELVVGAGTVLEPSQVDAVLAAGAQFAVAPGLNPTVIAHAQSVGLPFAPGVATPSDVEAGLAYGCTILKFFPAHDLGGIPYFRRIAAPYRHKGLQFIPTGGLQKRQEIIPWLQDDLILAIGSGWIAPSKSIVDGNWKEIGMRARRIVKLAQRAR